MPLQTILSVISTARRNPRSVSNALRDLSVISTARRNLYTLFILSTLCVTTAHARVAGFTPGEFSVDQNGGANYNINLISPPGSAGMQPALNISYSSQSGNGILGHGFTLGGLSVISRCGQTLLKDGKNRGVKI